MVVVRRYNFKLYPNKAQSAALERQTVLLAQLWNAALEQRETQWRHECQRNAKGERKGLSYFDQARQIKFIRADDPEIAAMSCASLELCLKALDEAFKAFYRRAKGGAGKSSGYPRFKLSKPAGKDWRHYHHDTIWHRDGSGWRLDKVGKHFKVYAKGVPGLIKARGKFPVALDELELRDMRIMRRDGCWFCSIVVRMEPRRVAGNTNIEVAFDLIEEFATVKNRANGECLPGLMPDLSSGKGQITSNFQRDTTGSVDVPPKKGSDDSAARGDPEAERVDVPPKKGSDDREPIKKAVIKAVDVPLKMGSEDRVVTGRLSSTVVDVPPKMGSEDRDDIQSVADRRYKRGSWRWRRAKARIANLKAKEARQRREDLHRWTTKITRECADLLVVCPPVKDSTKSARGSEKFHGAAVKPVAMLNRHVLMQAPAAAIQMLEYKAEEAGISFTRVEPSEHKLEIGKDLPVATKAGRKARRIIRKEYEGETV